MSVSAPAAAVVLASEHQVLQQVDGAAALPLVQDGNVSVRVLGSDGTVVVDWRATADGQVHLPVGGPYAVELSSGADEPVRVLDDLLVGDLWVLGGQSNMQGGAVMRDLEEPGPFVRLLGMDRRWQLPVEPLHRLWLSPDPVHHQLWEPELRPQIDQIIAASLGTATPHVGAGLGIAFANQYTQHTGIPVGLVPTAYGGSSLGDWSPTHPGGEGHCLYAGMLAMVRAAGGAVAGLLWHQGESETGSEHTVATYVESTRAVFDALRRDLGAPDLPVYLAQLGFFPIVRDDEAAARWTRVRAAQLALDALGADGVVATADLSRSDPIHLDAVSQRRLGRRFANLAAGAAGTISIAEVTQEGPLVDWPEVMAHRIIRIRLAGVTGGLQPRERVPGFSVRDPQGRLVPSVWRAEVDPSAHDTVVVQLAGPPVEGAQLYYGWGSGADTVCQLVDDADMAVPTLGPIPL